jgi:hypothetical protein
LPQAKAARYHQFQSFRDSTIERPSFYVLQIGIFFFSLTQDSAFPHPRIAEKKPVMQMHQKNFGRKYSIHARIQSATGIPGLLIYWRILNNVFKDHR